MTFNIGEHYLGKETRSRKPNALILQVYLFTAFRSDRVVIPISGIVTPRKHLLLA